MRSRMVMVLFVFAAGVAWAQAPLWQQDFEKFLPGEIKAGWGRSWGEQGDDLLLVSNIRAASGAHSLLLDRKTSTNEKMWGALTSLPDVPDGWLALSISFLVQGVGNDAHFGFELRATNLAQRACNVGFGDRRQVTLQSGDWKQSASLGAYTEDTWHRLRIWAPTRGGKGIEAVAVLERRAADGTWMAVTPPQRVPAVAPDKYGALMLNTAPEKRNFLVFLDDCSLQQVAAPPAE